jgi:membrane associated rhomboid family serine protease
MQWLLLRRALNRTGWWPVMNVVAWPLGSILGGALGAAVGMALGSPLVAEVVSLALTGAIIGAITGAVLLWLLRENAALLEGLRQERAAEPAKP